MSGENKKREVLEMFDDIAPTYDTLNHVLSLGIDRSWRRRVVRAVAGFREKRASCTLSQSPEPGCTSVYCPGSGDRRTAHNLPTFDENRDGREGLREFAILDVATGTGDLAIALGRAIPGARVTGVDISEKMLAVGQTKLSTLAARVELRVGDAEALEFPGGTFDAVTVAFGVRNFGDIPRGLAEMRRVLRPGGRLWVLEFSEPRGALFGPLYRFYFHRVLPLVGRSVSRHGGAYTYLPRSVDAFPEPGKFAEMLRAAGFSTVTARKLTFGVAHIFEAH